MAVVACLVAASKWNMNMTSKVANERPERRFQSCSLDTRLDCHGEASYHKPSDSNFYATQRLEVSAKCDLEATAPMLSLLEQTPIRASYLYACSPGDCIENMSPLKRMVAKDFLHQMAGGHPIRISHCATENDAPTRFSHSRDTIERVDKYHVHCDEDSTGTMFEMEL